MTTSKTWMIYGANGYTGTLTAELAIERGLNPILAGRNQDKVRALAERLDLDHRVFSLNDAEATRHGLSGVDAVVHAAGPFSATSRPMLDACLATATHYLDVTGEIAVFEAIHSRNLEAEEAGVSLIPGVGFDVVPTDCLIAMLKAKLPDATALEGAFHGSGQSSVGTTKTMVEGLPTGGRARVDGAIVEVPTVWKTKEVPFADKTRLAVTIPWGDISTAFYSTGIPNISFYMAFPARGLKWLRMADKMRGVLGMPIVQRGLKRLVEWRVKGPDAEARASGFSQIWAEVRNASGRRVSGTLTTPEGYTLTADSSIKAVLRVLEGVPAGAMTPSMAFGADFVLELDDVTLHPFEDSEPSAAKDDAPDARA